MTTNEVPRHAPEVLFVFFDENVFTFCLLRLAQGFPLADFSEWQGRG